MAHYKDQDLNLREPSLNQPLRVLISACLGGVKCGYDGSSNGEYPQMYDFIHSPFIKIVQFCPEEFSFGSPREMCDIYGGNGMDVLDGKAKVLTPSGADWTEGMIQAAEKMRDLAIENQIELAIMMDISAACGSTVIYDGNRFAENKVYQTGTGVCAALLIRSGIRVISQRDFKSLEQLRKLIDSNYVINEAAINHHETEWYRTYFNQL